MRSIAIFLTTQFAALIGYYLGRFRGPFTINKFTLPALRAFQSPLDESNPESFLWRLIQRFGSAGSGIGASLAIYSFARAVHIDVPISSWIVASLIVAWFAASVGFTGRFQCSLIAFGFFWLVGAVLWAIGAVTINT
jgi:hypothetical protein